MVLALRRDNQFVVHRRVARRGRGTDHAASPIVELYRQRVLERRPDQSACVERSAAEDEQAAAALGDEVGGHGQLGAGEGVGLDIGNDERIVRVEVLAASGKTHHER